MSRAREAVLPAYVFLCLVIGGSTQAVWGNALLQALALAIIAWAALTRDPQPMTRASRGLVLLMAAVLALILAQLLPLPPALWSALPSRQFLAEGFERLGMPLTWMPLSLAPYDTLATAMTVLPPLALIVAMVRLRSWNWSEVFASILLGTAVSVTLGILQVTAGDGSWYFYRVTNLGVAVGTFANGNHLATLLLTSMPILAALAASRLRATDDRPRGSLAIGGAVGGAAVLAVGAVINSSAAFLLLGPPVAAASVMLAMRLSPQRLRQAWLAILIFLGLAAAALAFAGKDLPGWGTGASIETRMEFWSNSIRAAKDEALTGAGIGAFQKAYQRYEDPARVDRFYVNHAHNDFLEVAVETGIVGIVLLLAFLVWWTIQARAAWAAPDSSLERKAAAVASAAILLHSLFDYPLRTTAMASVMAVSLALLAGARGIVRESRSIERRPARHATL